MQIKKRKSSQQNVLSSNRKACRGKPSCCAACGNPAYPECKTSCPLFDD